MAENSDTISQLHEKLEALLKRQELFSGEINELRIEINKFKDVDAEPVLSEIESSINADIEIPEAQPEIRPVFVAEQPKFVPPKYIRPQTTILPEAGRNIEKFIGENLISKIGIIITVIGVAIGAKYSIDHQLINPFTRIIMGYMAGLILFGFGIKLKAKYENYSAVLVSGAMAIMYFITYFAYDFYGLMPQYTAFALMVVFTAVTVVAAIKYNMQVIALIGLVGAYGVPFMLSNNTGNVAILFTYIAIINAGILVIAFQKYWKPICYSSFLLTWLIYFAWYSTKYHVESHLGLALVFLSVFFLIFYVTFLAYKLIQKEKFDIGDIVLLLANSFIFFGIGYSILDGHAEGQYLLGLFSVCNALIHFIVEVTIYKQKLADRNLGYLVTGLTLVFITIAIPVQLDGNWVTLLWAGEAALLFWIGRTKGVSYYEMLSYILMICAFISIIQDWNTASYITGQQSLPKPFLNKSFLSSVLFVGAFAFINIVNSNKTYSLAVNRQDVLKIMSFIIPGILLIALYNAFRLEITNYWDQLYYNSDLTKQITGQLKPDHFRNEDIPRFKAIWTLNYTLFFIAVMSFVNFKWTKHQLFADIILVVGTLAILVFLGPGLYMLSELRESYLSQEMAQYYQIAIIYLWIRYISMAFAALMLFAAYKNIYRVFLNTNLKMVSELVYHFCLVWIASSELINWMNIAGSMQSYKLGLSILWGVYALMLIVLGIWKRKKHLRIGAIVLFTGTLVKLFLYDISTLDTIAKTIVFVSLGVLLLIISFLYNKYKHIISGEIEKQE